MTAHLARDEDQGRIGRTVRDFTELRGLARSDKQKLILADTETSGVALATFFASGSSAIAALLASCQRHTKPVRPEDLGLIGAEHLLKGCMAAGAAAQSFKYRKHIDAMRNGLPHAIEASFASTQAQAKIADHPTFAAAREKIPKGYVRAERAVAALRALQADTHRELAMTLGVENASIPASAAQREAPAAVPLINTEHDFAATNRRLIAQKKYEAEEKS